MIRIGICQSILDRARLALTYTSSPIVTVAGVIKISRPTSTRASTDSAMGGYLIYINSYHFQYGVAFFQIHRSYTQTILIMIWAFASLSFHLDFSNSTRPGDHDLLFGFPRWGSKLFDLFDDVESLDNFS